MYKKEQERFNNKWIKNGQCKLWTGKLDKDGYGTFYFIKKSRRAHRVAYFFEFGDIPKDMVIDHICGNRHCVEPSHLRAVTKRENALHNSRSIAAINAQKTHCVNGHPFDRKYGKQRYCSICDAAKSRRLRQKWKKQADMIKC